MCVIFVVKDDKRRPTAQMVEKAWDWNSDGGGLAYRDNGEVVWQKGIMDFDEFDDLIQSLPTPYIAHFRIASSGGVRSTLCHPFPVDDKVSLALSGRTKGNVLFHNGDWKGWDEAARYAVINSRSRLPRGKWNDTRTLAWLTHLYGESFMELLPDQRGVLFGPDTLETFWGRGWYDINGVWCSNDIFLTKGKVRADWRSYICSFGQCRRADSLDKDNRCPEHGKPQVSLARTNEVSPVPQVPFRHPAPQTHSQKLVIGVSLAETMYKDNRLSKKKLNKIRESHEALKQPGISDARKNRVIEKLVQITNNIFPPGAPLG